MNPFVVRALRNTLASWRRSVQAAAVLALAAGCSAAAHAQPGAAADGGLGLAAPFGVLVLLVACAWAFLHVLKKRQAAGGQGPDGLQVMGSTALGASQRAVLLRAGERVFLLGVSAQQVNLLAELERAPPARVMPDSNAQEAFVKR